MRLRAVAASAHLERLVVHVMAVDTLHTTTLHRVANPGLAVAASRRLASNSGRHMHLRVGSVNVLALALAPVSVRVTVHAVRRVPHAPHAVNFQIPAH